MDGIKYAVFTVKSIRLLEKTDWTFDVETGSIRIEIKHRIELFFTSKGIAMVYLSKNAKALHKM